MRATRPRRLPGAAWWLCLLVLALMGGFVALRFELVSGISHFLPEGTDRELAPLARELAESELSRTVIVTLEARDPDAAVDAAHALAERLRTAAPDDALAEVRSGPPDGVEEAFHALYFPRRLAFLAEHPARELPALLSDHGLRQRADDLARRLARPGAGAFTRSLAPADPLLAFERHLERVAALQRGSLRVHRGHFLATDDAEGASYGVVMFATRASPFDGARQRPLFDWLEAELDAVEREHAVDIELSAAHRFALTSEASIRADITRISIASTVGLVLLFLVVLRRPRYLVLAFLPLGAGFLAALAVTLAVFGEIHGLTLAFGASLLGVCIDYPIHLFNHHGLDPADEGPEATARRLWMGLFLGAATTIAGFSGLAWTELPGIREIALFASVGVAASLLVTRVLLPPLVPARPAPVAAQRRAADALARALAYMRQKPRRLLVLPLAALLVCAVGLPRVTWVDDVSALNELDPALLAEDTRVRKRVSRMESGQLVLALGPDTETALRHNDAVAEHLEQARADGLVDDFRSLHGILWSAERQQLNLAATYGDPTLPARLDAALEAAGFTPAGFAPWREDLAAGPPEPLRYEDLQADPALSALVAPFRVELGDQVAVLTLLHGLNDPDALAEHLAPLGDDVRVFDQRTFLERTYRHVRTRSLELVAVGLLAVVAMLFARYRSARTTLAAFAPALLAALTTLGVLGLAGTPVHILHVVSLLLVLSIGVDYGVFLAESRRHGTRGLAATLLSIAMACASTVLAFGLLAMSSMPALRAIGLSVGIGVVLSLVLAPAALVLAGAAEPERSGP